MPRKQDVVKALIVIHCNLFVYRTGGASGALAYRFVLLKSYSTAQSSEGTGKASAEGQFSRELLIQSHGIEIVEYTKGDTKSIAVRKDTSIPKG